MEDVVVGVPYFVAEDMNEVLNGEYTKEEVVTALNQMDPLKAPGPDGLLPLFFQHYWSLVGEDVKSGVELSRLGCYPSIHKPDIHHPYPKGKKSYKSLWISPYFFM